MFFQTTKIAFFLFLSVPTMLLADSLTDVHRRRHLQVMQEQPDAVAIQNLADSLAHKYDCVGEEDDPYANLDIYSDWDDAHVDPLRGKTGWIVPDSQYISFKGYVQPIRGKVNSPYGWRRRRMHKGVDLKLIKGDTVVAAWDGKVRIRKFDRRGYGYYYVIRHANGLETVYGHLSKFIVQVNDSVKAGQPIGLGGSTGRSTGPHLHLEFRFMGIALDPAELIDFDTFEPKHNPYLFRRKHAELVQEGLAGDGDAAYHRVRQGDTLGAIARKYHTSVERLCRLNKMSAKKTLRIGQRIRYK
ncbi:MAG: LysM peptidoglycan-binding domain-containing protein [Bacteroidales bacterium]|nr:LysM peptidoglycan-binding domain-containing protein [Bacteroidales bacterium]